MGRKRGRLDDYLSQRTKSQEVTLEENTQLSNQLFHLAAGVIFTVFLVFLALFEKEEGTLSDLPYVFGMCLLFFLLMGLIVLSLSRTNPGLFDRPAGFNQFVILIALQVVVFKFIKFSDWSPYLMPLSAFGMVGVLVFSQIGTLLITLLLAFYVGLSHGPEIAENNPLGVNFSLTVVLLIGAATAALGMKPVRRQSKPVIVGLYAGIMQALAVLCFQLMRGKDFSVLLRPNALEDRKLAELLGDPGWALAGGVLSGAVVTCLLPAIERVFGILTERRLLDLSDFSNELLSLIQERAPGTFQHTLNVAQLSSSAAEAIGGDSLLARVGAYYHDLGKVRTPEYFVENMGEDKSIHDRLSPSMSKIIIISHVKEGVVLAREAKLPQKIIDLIPMHHGTTLVEFFFHKAKRAAAAAAETTTPVDVEYRYPGPKPRFREAGILMLADTLEAMAKAESHPNPSRFRSMVHEVILKRLLDGQLDESDLTLNDLRVIEDSFVRTLTTMYHGRIKYPEADEGKKKKKKGKASEDAAGKADANAAATSADGPAAGAERPPAEDGEKRQRLASGEASSQRQPVRSSRG